MSVDSHFGTPCTQYDNECGYLWWFQQDEFKSYPVQPSIPLQDGGGGAPSMTVQNQQPMPDDYKSFDIVKATQYGVYERVVELIEGQIMGL